ncbi:MAG: organomercurial lyase [Acidimicrobiia bacterium]
MTADLDLFDVAGLEPAVAQAVRRIGISGFWALWSGQNTTLPQLLGDDSRAVSEAAAYLRSRGRLELSESGELVAVHGLVRRPTQHRIEHDAGTVNTWCALDAIGIPAALAIDARARTGCATCGVELAVSLSGGVPDPAPEAVLWYPEVRHGHLVDDFCAGANLFCSSGHLDDWRASAGTEGAVLTVDEVAELGREAWSDVAGEA